MTTTEPSTTSVHDATLPAPDEVATPAPGDRRPWSLQAVTALIVVGPPVALLLGVIAWWGDLVSLRDVIIGGALYVVSCIGIAVGYHRLFAHRSFRAVRPLKIALALAGSLAVEGSVVGWVATHRRHHRFSDRPGDPHSPNLAPTRLRGLVHAHAGWLFTADPTDEQRYASDIRADADLVRIGRWWGAIAVGGLLLPFGLGWLLSGTFVGGLSTFLWAGVVRMMVLQHVTWSVNSVCHSFGPRPFPTRDQSRNVAILAVASMGESFHNGHHAFPRSARHGVLPHQVDAAATTIRLFERLGWATEVQWPDRARLAALVRRAPDRLRAGEPPPT